MGGWVEEEEEGGVIRHHLGAIKAIMFDFYDANPTVAAETHPAQTGGFLSTGDPRDPPDVASVELHGHKRSRFTPLKPLECCFLSIR